MEVDWERRDQLIKERRLAADTIEDLIETLKSDGLRVKEAAYRDQDFGSWHFVMCGQSACVRVVFDGRDGFLRFDVWQGSTEYEVWIGSQAGQWETAKYYNPDLTKAEIYGVENIRREFRRCANEGV